MVTITSRSVLLVFFCLCGGYASTSENNVCPTFKDYYTIKHNPHCWYDVAAEKTSVRILRKIVVQALFEESCVSVFVYCS